MYPLFFVTTTQYVIQNQNIIKRSLMNLAGFFTS